MSTRDELLYRALTIAMKAHHGQTDRAGDPYITHPLRMMGRTQKFDEQIVALLHDCVEDGLSNGVTLATIEEAFPKEIAHAVDCMTHRTRDIASDRSTDDTYEAFVERAASDPIARAVKLLDLQDNMDITRLPEVTPADVDRLNRYIAAWRRLEGTSPGTG